MRAKPFAFKYLTEQQIRSFWSKVDIRDTGETECWEWRSCIIRSGYGMLTLNRKQLLANRVAWFISNKVDPYPLFVLHKCDNRKCVRPSHLFLGTNQENMTDMCRKLRNAYKLTPALVGEIKSMLANGIPQRKIARQFNIAQQTVCEINMNIIWKHLLL